MEKLPGILLHTGEEPAADRRAVWEASAVPGSDRGTTFKAGVR